jgi:AcrR family transcriptional regulator
MARRVAQTRREVTAAAARLFIEGGFDNTTVEDIATAAGIAPRTFYRYFAAKDEVIDELIDDRIRLFAAILHARPADEPLLDALRAAGRDSLAHAAENGLVELYVVVTRTPALRARWLARWNTYTAIITDSLSERLPTAEGHTAELAAGALIGMMTTIVDGHIHEPPGRLFDLLDSACHALVKGFAPTDTVSPPSPPARPDRRSRGRPKC